MLLMDFEIEGAEVTALVTEGDMEIESSAASLEHARLIPFRRGGKVAHHGDFNFIGCRYSAVANVGFPRRIFPQGLEQLFDHDRFDLHFPLAEPCIFVMGPLIVIGELSFETDSKQKGFIL
jgi:hypothetical protein